MDILLDIPQVRSIYRKKKKKKKEKKHGTTKSESLFFILASSLFYTPPESDFPLSSCVGGAAENTGGGVGLTSSITSSSLTNAAVAGGTEEKATRPNDIATAAPVETYTSPICGGSDIDDVTIPVETKGSDSEESNSDTSVEEPVDPLICEDDSSTLPNCEVEDGRLPIEYHAKKICDHVARHRVTIIHGETGCGKSSTVPIMLMKSHDEAWDRVQQSSNRSANENNSDDTLPINGYAKMFVTQPRRIAARSLCARVQSILSSENKEAIPAVGLRLGGGERSIDTGNTKIWFATTGYVVLLLAHHPERFRDHSHLVLDEVHERSIDTDVLCLLARKLLHANQHIKLVLMSATVS